MESQTGFRPPFDQNTPEAIIALDKSYRGLRAEMDIKIHNYTAYDGEYREMFLERFHHVVTQLDAAIQQVEELVLIANTQSAEERPGFYEQFKGLVVEQLNMLEQLKKEM